MGQARVATIVFSEGHAPSAALAALARGMWERGAVLAGSLDPAEPPLAETEAGLRAALRARCDLLILARFPGGLRAELAAALLSGTPMVVGVSEGRLAEWEGVLGATPRRVPPLPEALLAWAERALREPA